MYFSWTSMFWPSIKLCNPIGSKDIECRLCLCANDFDFLWFCSTCPAKSLIDINYDEKYFIIRNWWKVFWNSKYAWSINMMHPHCLARRKYAIILQGKESQKARRAIHFYNYSSSVSNSRCHQPLEREHKSKESHLKWDQWVRTSTHRDQGEHFKRTWAMLIAGWIFLAELKKVFGFGLRWTLEGHAFWWVFSFILKLGEEQCWNTLQSAQFRNVRIQDPQELLLWLADQCWDGIGEQADGQRVLKTIFKKIFKSSSTSFHLQKCQLQL